MGKRYPREGIRAQSTEKQSVEGYHAGNCKKVQDVRCGQPKQRRQNGAFEQQFGSTGDGPIGKWCGPHHCLGRGTSAPDSEKLCGLLKTMRPITSVRTHWSLNKDAPVSRPVQRSGVTSSHAIVGGLHHSTTFGFRFSVHTAGFPTPDSSMTCRAGSRAHANVVPEKSRLIPA